MDNYEKWERSVIKICEIKHELIEAENLFQSEYYQSALEKLYNNSFTPTRAAAVLTAEIYGIYT